MSDEKPNIWLKCYRGIGHCMSFILLAVTKVARKKENTLLYFYGNTLDVIMLTVTCTSAVLMDLIVFPWHQCLCERPAMLRYAYTLLTPFFFLHRNSRANQ